MGDEYTPTTGVVRTTYALFWAGDTGLTVPHRAEFNRWLKAERARIWDEGYGDDLDAKTPRTNPYREA